MFDTLLSGGLVLNDINQAVGGLFVELRSRIVDLLNQKTYLFGLHIPFGPQSRVKDPLSIQLPIYYMKFYHIMAYVSSRKFK